jgi:hypothetical protein
VKPFFGATGLLLSKSPLIVEAIMTHSKELILMRRTAGLTLVFGSIAVLTVLAKDFWADKPFTTWNEKEVRKILSDSPWAKIEHVTLPEGERNAGDTGVRAGSVPPPVATQAGGAAAGARGAGGGGGDMRAGGSQQTQGSPVTAPGGYGETAPVNQSVPLQVTWFSSLKIRQAMGRLGQLQGNISAAQLNTFVQQPVDQYIIAVSGPQMKPLEQANLETLKGTTFLLSKKDKNKKVELKEYVSPKDRKDGLALFVFPRTVDGKPSVDVADEEVQFVAEPAGLKIKTAFKLSKMMTDGKLDI